MEALSPVWSWLLVGALMVLGVTLVLSLTHPVDDSESLEAHVRAVRALSSNAGRSSPPGGRPATISQPEPNGTHTRGNRPGVHAGSGCEPPYDWQNETA